MLALTLEYQFICKVGRWLYFMSFALPLLLSDKLTGDYRVVAVVLIKAATIMFIFHCGSFD